MAQPMLVSSSQVPKESETIVFDSSVMSYESTIPEKFIWPDEFKPSQDIPELQVPEIDMKAFLSGDQEVISNLCSKVGEACKKHGFFHVVNHGVDAEMIAKAHALMDYFFGMPLPEKQKAQRTLTDFRGILAASLGDSLPNFHGRKPSLFFTLLRIQSKLWRSILLMLLGKIFAALGEKLESLQGTR
ncbi:hypothetical protein PIB30_061973 [Stylosanthes scabra]|uniref:Non-haem dioxygenase N-terminal domain-containing protein n=1 Tax=Stylosanthes scabra TaxID=79078 RepID=A0ABU6SLF5_9FABA|nr:hypothetical protein [Stylosanthes scabra]